MKAVAPLISVVIPVYNKAQYLETAVRSVLGQTFGEFELLMVDDASTDDSLERMSAFRDPRIRILRRDTPGPGGYAARNYGVGHAAADWVAFLDADDCWKPEHLAAISGAVEAEPGLGVVCANYESEKPGGAVVVKNPEVTEGTVLSGEEALRWFAERDFLHTSAVAVRCSAFEAAGGFPAGRAKRGGDSDLWLRLMLARERFAVLPGATAVYVRPHSDVMTDAANLEIPHLIARSAQEYLPLCRTRGERTALLRLINRKTVSRLRAKAAAGILRARHFRALEWRALRPGQLPTVLRLAATLVSSVARRREAE